MGQISDWRFLSRVKQEMHHAAATSGVQTGEVAGGTKGQRKSKERRERRMKMHYTRKEGLGSHMEQKEGSPGVMYGLRDTQTYRQKCSGTYYHLWWWSGGESENVIITREKGQ